MASVSTSLSRYLDLSLDSKQRRRPRRLVHSVKDLHKKAGGTRPPAFFIALKKSGGQLKQLALSPAPLLTSLAESQMA